jgi:hypothetical protein
MVAFPSRSFEEILAAAAVFSGGKEGDGGAVIHFRIGSIDDAC